MKNDKHPRLKIAVLISGRGSNLEALLKAISNGSLPAEVMLVLSSNKTARGLDVARAHKVPTAVVTRNGSKQTSEEFNLRLIETLSSYEPDLVVLAGFMHILTTEFVSAFSGKLINIHPSLLPAFRGKDAQQQALDAGVRFSGCTVHYVVPEVDAGPIIAQAVVPVFPDDTEESLSARILVEEHKLLPAVVREIAEGKSSNFP